MTKISWLRKIIIILLIGGILINLYILIGRAFWGDMFVSIWIKSTNYVNPSIYLFILLTLLFLFCKQEHKKISTHLWVVIYFIAIFFSIFQYDYYPLVIEGDGIGYFAYLHSMYFNRDLSFNNEYRKMDAAHYGVAGWIDESGRGHYPRDLKTNRQPNTFSIGPSLLWLPFYYAADLLHTIDHPRRNGYEPIYLNILNFSHLLYGLLGALLLYFTLISFFRPGISFLSILIILFLSPAYYYLRVMPFYSHVYSFFCISLYFFIFVKIRNRPNYWIIMGFAAGLATLMRWQNAAHILLPIFYTYAHLFKQGILTRKGLIIKILDSKIFWREHIKILGFLLGFFIFCIPQLIAFNVIYGHYLIIPQGGSFISTMPIWIFQTLFSSNHGLFNWHPVLILGVIGFFFTFKVTKRNFSDRYFYYTNALGFSLQTYINSSLPQFWAGAAFGARRFVDALGFLAFGMANFLETIWQKKLLRILCIPVFILFFFFNVFLEKAFSFNIILHEAPVPFIQLISSSIKQFLLMLDPFNKMIYFLILLILSLALFTHQLNRWEEEGGETG